MRPMTESFMNNITPTRLVECALWTRFSCNASMDLIIPNAFSEYVTYGMIVL